jgi:hypothetical protein
MIRKTVEADNVVMGGALEQSEHTTISALGVCSRKRDIIA